VNLFLALSGKTFFLSIQPGSGLEIDMADPNIDYWQVPAATPPNGTTSNFVNPPSVGNRQTITNIITLIIMIVVVLLRLYTRIFIVKSVGYDDCASISAEVSSDRH